MDSLSSSRAVGTLLAFSLIVLSILVLSLPSVSALSVTLPSTVEEGQPIITTVTGVGTITIFVDGVQVASGASPLTHSQQTGPTSAGMRTYLYVDAAGNETRTVQVSDVPLVLDIDAPLGTESTSSQVSFQVTTNWQSATCSVVIDGASNALTAVGTTHTRTLTLTDGIHTLVFFCSLGLEQVQQMKTFVVDTRPPVVTSSGPNGQQTGPYVTMTVDTDEIAQCRYGAQDLAFAALPDEFSSTYATRNTATLDIGEGSHTFFVRCRDVYGNTMQIPKPISFSVSLAPIASIDLDGEEPLGAGTYEVILTTTIPLQSAPELTSRFQGSGASQQVGLTGEGTKWRGYVVVPVGATDAAISFQYKGKSLQGVIGETIADGALYRIDAAAPGSVLDFRATNSPSGITLTWNAPDEEEYTYRIYRVAEEGASPGEPYATTGGLTYTDTSASGAIYYYYRVSAVDEAGNEGPLSYEAWGSALDSDATAEGDPALQAMVEEALNALHAAAIDTNTTISALEGESVPTKAAIIEDMGFLQDARDARVQIERMLVELASYRDATPSRDEVEGAVASSRELIEETRRALVTRIQTEGELESAQTVDLEEISRNLPYALLETDLDAETKDAYLASAVALQERATIGVEIRSFIYWDRAGGEHRATFVRKRIRLETPANDVRIIETIPKAVAASAGEILFAEQPLVLQDDPVVQYSYPVLEQAEISYTLDRIVPIEEVRKTQTLLYPAPAPGDPVLATGNATKMGGTIPGFDVLILIFGGIIVAGLLLYYFSISESQPSLMPPPPIAPQRIITRAIRPRARVRHLTRARAQGDSAPALPTDARSLLTLAREEIDGKRYDAAMRAYKAVIPLLESDSGLHAELSSPVKETYLRILLYKRLDDAQQAIGRRDSGAAKTALGDVRQLAQTIGEDGTLLITEAKRSYGELVRALNALEIELTEKY